MADQRVNVSNIQAGGNVSVTPVQTNIEGPPSSQRGWTEALLQGVLKRSGAADRAGQSESFSEEGDHSSAASSFEAVAKVLTACGYEPAADAYVRRAADSHAKAGNRDAARKLYLKLSRSTIGDGSLDAQMHARRAGELSSESEAWEAQALLARAAWPERVADDIGSVRRAWDQTRGTDDEAEWAAALVELLILTDENEQALEVAEETRAELGPIVTGDRLALELDYLDLIDDDLADAAWLDVREFVSDPRKPVESTGMAWQRRGVALTRRGDPTGAHIAFLQAAQHWAREPGYDDQTAEAYFSGLSALATAGSYHEAADGGPSLARALRGSKETATSRTERQHRRGLSALINGEYPDAFRFLSVAVAEARRAGNLSDHFQVAEALGDCLAAMGGHEGLALRAYRLSGTPEKAKDVVSGASVDDVLDVVPLTGAPWERRAAWAAVAGCGRQISDAGVIRVTEAALREEERDSARAFPTNASYYALEVLGAIVVGVPEASRSEVLALLRDRMTLGMGDPHAVANPLLAATRVGIADESAVLVTAFLDDGGPVVLSGLQIGEVARSSALQRERLVTAASEGSHAGLTALAYARAIDEPALRERAAARVKNAIQATAKDVTDENGTRTTSWQVWGSRGPEGLMASVCEPEVVEAFVDKMLETLGQDDLPLMTRISALDGLHNLGSALPAGRIDEVLSVLERLAVSADRLASMDRLDPDEPLARFKINMAPENALRGGAVEAMAAIGSEHPEAVERLRPAIAPALASGDERLICVALGALARHTDLAPNGLDVAAFLRAPWAGVRVAAFSVVVNHQKEARVVAAQMLAADPDAAVRLQVLNAAVALDLGPELIEKLSEDPDIYIRTSARLKMRERNNLATSGQSSTAECCGAAAEAPGDAAPGEPASDA